MSERATAILNRDTAEFQRLKEVALENGANTVSTFGQHPDADARLIRFDPVDGGSVVEASITGQTLRYRLGASGIHMAMNSLAALLMATKLNVDPAAAAGSLTSFQPLQGRGEIHQLRTTFGAIVLIDETYNASPTSVRAALRALNQPSIRSFGRRVVVLGDMMELGPTAATIHRELAADVMASRIDIVHCCGSLMHRCVAGPTLV
jgi:UDP-N-acetylmuramoyl-tripeptide--D-alanyl-D-alanine ligase